MIKDYTRHDSMEHSLDAQRARQRQKAPSTEQKLQEQLDSLPAHIRTQVEGGTNEGFSEGARLSRDAEGNVRRIVEGSGRITAGAFSSSQERIAKEMDEQNKAYAAAVASGDHEGARVAKARREQLEASLQLQQQVDEAENYDRLHDEQGAAEEMQQASELLDEREQNLTVNARRAKYGLAPL